MKPVQRSVPRASAVQDPPCYAPPMRATRLRRWGWLAALLVACGRGDDAPDLAAADLVAAGAPVNAPEHARGTADASRAAEAPGDAGTLAVSGGSPPIPPHTCPGEDVLPALRARLVLEVFRAPTLPDAPPDAVEVGVSAAAFDAWTELARADELLFAMDYGTSSTALLLHPAAPRGELVVYHLGHGQGFGAALPILRDLLGRGLHVVVLAMPLTGPNPELPEATVEGAPVPLRGHDSFAALEAAGHPVMHLFVEPVHRAIRHALAVTDVATVHMVGLSGGGWTTVLAAALDPRIRTSVPIAGALPLDLREEARGDLGDFEQLGERPLYRLAGYRELYLLASGPGRAQLQIFNERDECCFSVEGREDALRAMERELRTALGGDPACGDFRVHVVRDQVEHAVTEEALELVAAALAR